MKIEVGQTYITVGGNECDILYKNDNVTDGFNFIGLVRENHLNAEREKKGFNDFLAKFREDGRAATSASLVKKKPVIKTIKYAINLWLLGDSVVANHWKSDFDAADRQLESVKRNSPQYQLLEKIRVEKEVEINV